MDTSKDIKNIESSADTLYTEAELLRLRDCLDLDEDEIQKVLNYIDPLLKYESILEPDVPYWILKENKSIDLPTDDVEIELSKLKENTVLYDYFIEDTIMWIHNFYFHWKLKKLKNCNIQITDKSPPESRISLINKKNIGKYCYFNVRVKRISTLNIAITTSFFQCDSCKREFCIDRLWYEKLKDTRCNCGTRTPPVEKENNRRYETWQTISVQDIKDQGVDENSGFLLDVRVLKAKDFFKILPGEEVKIKGILRTEVTEKAKAKLYMDLFSIDHVITKKTSNFNARKIEKLKKFSLKENLWVDLKTNLFPHIVGLDCVKEAAILQFLGGSGATSRTAIHLLVAGDAGVGKSQILKSIQKTLGGFYATGLGSSVAGLTATVYKDIDNQWNLDGGAVVLASGSTLLLDEADKLPLTVCNSLLEPMEQQTVSISKAGISVNLPAKTKIFAVSNPKIGQKFDTNSTVSLRDQLGFAPPFLSRFDLIFLITEESQKNDQKKMAEKVLEGCYKNEPDVQLVEYLRYAKTINPQIPQNIKKRIIEYYELLKTQYQDTLSVGPRYIEGIARLCEAKAKSRLALDVSVEDLEYVKSLVEQSIKTQGIRPNIIINHIPQLLELYVDKNIDFLSTIVEIIKQKPLEINELFLKVAALHPKRTYSEFNKAIFKLEKEGVIYKPDGQKYKLI